MHQSTSAILVYECNELISEIDVLNSLQVAITFYYRINRVLHFAAYLRSTLCSVSSNNGITSKSFLHDGFSIKNKRCSKVIYMRLLF